MRRPQVRGIRREGRTFRVEQALWDRVLAEVARRNAVRAADPTALAVGVSEVLRDLLREALPAIRRT